MYKNCISFFHTFVGSSVEPELELNIPGTPRTDLTDKQVRQRNRSFDEKYESIHVCTPPNIHDDDCAICVEPIKENDMCKILGCNHVYHVNCIKKWVVFKNKQTCPMCNSFIQGMNEYIIKG